VRAAYICSLAGGSEEEFLALEAKGLTRAAIAAHGFWSRLEQGFFFRAVWAEPLCEAGRLPAPRRRVFQRQKRFLGTGGYASRRRLTPHAVYKACHARSLAWQAGKRPAGAGISLSCRVGGAPA
jgi:hypothetical protein